MGRAFWGGECSDDRREHELRLDGKFAYACVLAESGKCSSNSACRSSEGGASVVHELGPWASGASVESACELECWLS